MAKSMLEAEPAGGRGARSGRVVNSPGHRASLVWMIVVSATCLGPVVDGAESAEERGLAIARERDRRDSGFGDSRADATMVLRTRQGEESRRTMRVDRLEQEDDGDKTLVVFNDPPDVKGTALLTYTHRKGSDDQWLYLPALKRVKRISSGNRSGPFVGSEFSYEDLLSEELAKYTYRYVREERFAGNDCHVVERQPVYGNSGYTKQVLWLDKAEFRLWKIDYYDRKQSRLKTLTYSGYQQYLGRFWRASSFSMVNHQNGKSTEILFHRWAFRTGLTDRDFDQSSLRRAR